MSPEVARARAAERLPRDDLPRYRRNPPPDRAAVPPAACRRYVRRGTNQRHIVTLTCRFDSLYTYRLRSLTCGPGSKTGVN